MAGVWPQRDAATGAKTTAPSSAYASPPARRFLPGLDKPPSAPPPRFFPRSGPPRFVWVPFQTPRPWFSFFHLACCSRRLVWPPRSAVRVGIADQEKRSRFFSACPGAPPCPVPPSAVRLRPAPLALVLSGFLSPFFPVLVVGSLSAKCQETLAFLWYSGGGVG